MMERRDITNALKTGADGAMFITRIQVAQVLGYKDPHNVDRFLKGLERIAGNRYYIPDVAERIIATRS